VPCFRCGAAIPAAARFCQSCGTPASSDAETVAATDDATRLSPGSAGAGPGRTVSAGSTRPPSSGWLTGSNSIDHGRFGPGTLLDGRYRIIGLLGRGGMGEVYRADDLRLGQPVALKFLPEDLHHDPIRLGQFHNEVRTARQVSHANVCRVYDIGEIDGLLYLSMEYVDGEDLATSLRRIGRFPEDKAADIARQLCAGLAAAHQRGVIHRDLKPANVMLDGAGRVRVMDFGLAAIGLVEDIRAGTPAYMAPEQLQGREVTERSDIFALGLVMYELFTGRRAFTAATVGDLVAQHQTRSMTPPSTIVTAIDPAIERAILRCLDPDPARRPASALAVSAALPGGDPLAAALAAGETPSPEMVAAAGKGAGLEPRVAWAVFVAVLAGMATSFAMALRTSPLDRMRPSYPPEVLAQKARDAVRQLGFTARPGDEAYGFRWNEGLTEHVKTNDKPAPRWDVVFTQRPSPLEFWYRQSREPLTATTFHTDLLTPGIVETDDPPPIKSGMTEVTLDHEGRLTLFESIPAQHLDTPIVPSPVDWGPLFTLADLDRTKLQPAEPLWNWLAASDIRAAWTGTWPGSGRPLRVEAAALGGRPVAFMLTGPWRKATRMPDDSAGRQNRPVLVLFALAFSILAGATMLARANLRRGRGDWRGATRLGAGMSLMLLGLWLCHVHLVASIGLLAMFLLAVCTSVFYGVLLWTIYTALEPFVRRHWPHVLVSSTNILTGRVRDPVVGRDVLFGAALGVAWVLMLRASDLLTGGESFASFPGNTDVLTGVRGTLGVVLERAPYAIRNVLLFFFLLFVIRRVVRSEWGAALIFAGTFALLSALGNDEHPWLNALISFLYFGSGAFVVLRWGLVSFATGLFVSDLLVHLPATVDASAWYFGNMMLLVAIAVGLTSWAVYTSMARPRSADVRIRDVELSS
jgi:serine/threonine-protein kinase